MRLGRVRQSLKRMRTKDRERTSPAVAPRSSFPTGLSASDSATTSAGPSTPMPPRPTWMRRRPQVELSPEVSAEEIARLHKRHMAQWAELELTPERIAALREERANRAQHQTKPWEDDDGE